MFVLRNLTSFRRCTTVKYQTFYSSLYSLSQETVAPNSFGKELESNSKIFDFIDKNQEYLTSKSCIELLKNLTGHSITNFRSCTTNEKKYLLIVCNELDKQINNLNFTEIIEVFKLLCKIEIPKDSIIFQSVLRRIQSEIGSITNLNDDKIKELKQLLEQMKGSALVKTIENNLKIALESMENTRNHDITLMCSNLYKAVNSTHVNKELIITILHEIFKYPHEIKGTTAASIFVSCMKFPEIIISENLNLRKIENDIIKNTSKLNLKNIFDILEPLSILNKNTLNDDLYNSQFIDSLVVKALSFDNLLVKDGISILSFLQKIGHRSTNLIDYLMIKFFENQFLISKLSRNNFVKFVSGLTLCANKPPLWDSIKHIIINDEKFKTNDRPFNTRLAYDLATLNVFHHDLISNVFESTPKQYELLYFFTRERMIHLYQLVKLFDASYNGPWPSESLLKMILNETYEGHDNPVNDNIINTLHKALGGQEYVQSNVKTKYGHFINNVVVMRKGGFPVAINIADTSTESKRDLYIEDIIVPPESQIIAFVCFKNGAYLRNVNELRRQCLSYVKSLEALNYSVIPMYLPKWMSLTEKSKIPFIMNEIKLKCPTDEN